MKITNVVRTMLMVLSTLCSSGGFAQVISLDFDFIETPDDESVTYIACEGIEVTVRTSNVPTTTPPVNPVPGTGPIEHEAYFGQLIVPKAPNQPGNPSTEILVEFSFSEPVSDPRVAITDLDYRAFGMGSLPPIHEWLHTISPGFVGIENYGSLEPPGELPAGTVTPRDLATPLDRDQACWMLWEGCHTTVSFVYHRPEWLGLIIPSIEFERCMDPEPTCTPLEFYMNTDNNGTAMRWEIRRAGCDEPVCFGDDYANDAACQTNTCCLLDGDYVLEVFNDNGGTFTGSYLLRSLTDGRIVENPDGFIGNSTLIPFSLPMSHVRPSPGTDSRDRMDLHPNNILEVVGSNAQCTWWVFDPDGGYNAVLPNIGQTLMLSTLPTGWELGKVYNFRATSAAGVYGQASTFRITPNVAPCPCPIMRLVDRPMLTAPVWPETLVGFGDQHSCDITLTSQGQILWANYNTDYAHYQLELTCVSGSCAGNPPITITHSQNNMVNNHRQFKLNGQPGPGIGPNGMPNMPDGGAAWPTSYSGSTTWMVRTRVKRNLATEWCAYGPCCRVTIPEFFSGGGGQNLGHNNNLLGGNLGEMTLYPNPNRGDQFMLSISEVPAQAETVDLELYDLTGKRVVAQMLTIENGRLNTTVDLTGALPTGVYMVRCTVAGQVHTQRMVVQP